MNKLDIKRAKLALELAEQHLAQARRDAAASALENKYAVETNRIARDIAAVDLEEAVAEIGYDPDEVEIPDEGS